MKPYFVSVGLMLHVLLLIILPKNDALKSTRKMKNKHIIMLQLYLLLVCRLWIIATYIYQRILNGGDP